jgi:hypothetical protein
MWEPCLFCFIRGLFSRCARCAAPIQYKFIPNMCLWTYDLIARAIRFLCRSIMFPHTSGAPVFEELAVMDSCIRVTLGADIAVRGEGDCSRRYCKGVLSLARTAWPVFEIVEGLERVAPRNLYRVVIFALFLTLFCIILVLNSMLPQSL